MNAAPANPLRRLVRRIADWLLAASPAAGGQPQSDEARRKSIRDVTHEQLGIGHWSCHVLF